jgi:hypothetical protein
MHHVLPRPGDLPEEYDPAMFKKGRDMLKRYPV